MNHLRLIILSLFITSCTQTKTADTTLTTDSAATDTTSTEQIEDVTSEEEGEEAYDEEECVFDTSTYKFTTEALIKYDKNISFHWDKETASALVRLNQNDSLILHIGGCSHFGYSATFITDASKFKDRAYLFQKTKWLAENFFSNGFDEKYADCIAKELYTLNVEDSQEDILNYSIIDMDTAITDHVYLGWTFEKVGSKTKIELDGYIN